jgi:cell wall-associated NlpC family hydrolase
VHRFSSHSLLSVWGGLLLLLVTACAPDINQFHVRDLEKIPQDPHCFAISSQTPQPLLNVALQLQHAEDYLQRCFEPWHSKGPLASTKHPFWAIDWLSENALYGKNLLPLREPQRQSITEQTRPQTYPSLHQPAITLRRCSARALPTDTPVFYNPRHPGQGFPFDQLQHAVLAANTPVLVTHCSADGAWLFVETAAVYGWVETDAVAGMSDEQIREVEALPLVTVLRDDTGVFDAQNHWLLTARTGTLLPVLQSTAERTTVLIAVADAQRQAVLRRATIDSAAVASFPLAFTADNMARIAAPMMGQPYDWGEQFGGRDCSATLRDLFAPFGIWLPRNSSQQAKVGDVIALADLSPEQREQLILEQGIPFATLISLPGHIMLYVGQHDGHAIVLHTLWGLKTTSLFGKEGRWLVGKTILTTLQPGLEQDGLWQSIGDLRSRITQMNLPLCGAQSEEED